MFRVIQKRIYSTSQNKINRHTENVRNIGIIAHIDAGKTTTTERMLYYSGFTRRIGEVDRGDTVMDYLPEEKERGITIKAAAITFPWADAQINLIDTPGHVDFGMEVERSLRVLDGAITIVDGSAGVQAQTRTVWRQAAKRDIPRMIYINKMDKVGADFGRTLADLRCKLTDLQHIPVMLPILDGEKGMIAGVDLIRQKVLTWSGERGSVVNATDWDAVDRSHFVPHRDSMVESIASLDETLLELFLEDPNSITELQLDHAIRRLLVQRRIAPVFCGSSFTNIGVQPLMDAAVKYFPSPVQQPGSTNLKVIRNGDGQISEWPILSEALLALAFKVIHDEQRGLLVFVRIYSGTLSRRTVLQNSTQRIKERPLRVMRIYANKFEEIEEAYPGDVVVLTGLKNTRTGDTLLSEVDTRGGGISCKGDIRLTGIEVPEPVFTCSVEAESGAEEGILDEALRIVSLEDPSVRTKRDAETGQTQLSGMGELHLEIVGKRITRDLRAKARFGEVQISYKEYLDINGGPLEINEDIDKEMNGLQMSGGLKLRLENLQNSGTSEAKFMTGSFLRDEYRESITDGLMAALQQGPLACFPIGGLIITVLQANFVSGVSSPTALRYIAYQIMKNYLNRPESRSFLRLMEPIMSVEISVPPSHLGYILTDIHSNRRGIVIESNSTDGTGEVVMMAEIPLAEILGYASQLRSRTAGHGSFSMQPLCYRPMSFAEQSKFLLKLGLHREIPNLGAAVAD